MHQPSGGFQGQATDIMLHAQEILNLKKRLNEIYVKHTGQQLKKIEDALERDTFLTAEGAKGLIVDLRGNGGGYLDQSATVANLFLNRGQEVSSVRGRAIRACPVPHEPARNARAHGPGRVGSCGGKHLEPRIVPAHRSRHP